MCKYSDDTGYKCPHENLEDSDCCSFHLQDDNKDLDEFNKGIAEILEKEDDSINFHGFYFPPDLSDFSKQNFKKEIDFYNVTFSGEANFKDVTFSGYADFMYVTFSREANFWGAKFSGKANFWGAKFSDEANFMSAKFSGTACFKVTTFSRKADFLNGIFFGEVYFIYAKISGYANFRNAKFSKDADFRQTIFSGGLYFIHAKFLDTVNFIEAKLSGDADFRLAIFSRGATFWGATFSGKADFSNAQFLEDGEFNRIILSGQANFREAIFSRDAIFKDAEITGKFEFIPDKSETIIFQNTYFSDNVRIQADLSKCSIANSNIERVDMTNSIWIRDDDKPKKSFSAYKKRFKEKIGLSDTSIIIWEEHQGELKDNRKELEGIYRRLKQSCQKFGDTSTAGKFYYQEMECKREQLKGIEKHFWYLFYKKLCAYGEKPFNVIWASILIILTSSLLFFYLGIELVGSEVLDVPPRVIDYNLSLDFMWGIINFNSWIGDFGACLYTSVITFTTLGYGDVRPIGLSRFVASVEAGFGIIMTALFIFVFTRKMLR